MSTIKVYGCKNCESIDVRQHVLINGTAMLPVNQEMTEQPRMASWNVRQRGFYECYDCGHSWTKNEDGEWFDHPDTPLSDEFLDDFEDMLKD